MENVEKMLKMSCDLGLSTLGEEYAEYFAEQSKETMAELWNKEITSAYVQGLSLEDLLKLPFDVAHKYINQFTMDKRIKILSNLSTYRDHLYNQTGRYGGEGLSAAEQISAADFRMLLGKIKHLEILQNWLYGIE